MVRKHPMQGAVLRLMIVIAVMGPHPDGKNHMKSSIYKIATLSIEDANTHFWKSLSREGATTHQ
jgi:hypothetical protein